MKKIFLLIILFISFNAFAFSESGISLGFGYDLNYTRFTYNEINKYYNASAGIIINVFYIKNDIPVGFFANGILGFPQANNSNFDDLLQTGINFGGVFRKNLTENMVEF